jgi:hypothetical protein
VPTYQIEQTATAAILWEGTSASKEGALEAYAQNAGYASYAALREEHSGAGVEIRELHGVALVQHHLERIGVADSGHGGVIAQAVEGKPTLVEVLDENAGGTYEVRRVLPILESLPSDLADTFADDDTFAGVPQTASEKAYEHFWDAVRSAETDKRRARKGTRAARTTLHHTETSYQHLQALTAIWDTKNESKTMRRALAECWRTEAAKGLTKEKGWIDSPWCPVFSGISEYLKELKAKRESEAIAREDAARRGQPRGPIQREDAAVVSQLRNEAEVLERLLRMLPRAVDDARSGRFLDGSSRDDE